MVLWFIGSRTVSALDGGKLFAAGVFNPIMREITGKSKKGGKGIREAGHDC
jgi:hypothetical protein